jgi:hypothetical protein
VIDEFIPAIDCTAGEAAGNWMAEEGRHNSALRNTELMEPV